MYFIFASRVFQPKRVLILKNIHNNLQISYQKKQEIDRKYHQLISKSDQKGKTMKIYGQKMKTRFLQLWHKLTTQ